VNNCPRVQEADESYEIVFPHEARIRNLTYATELYVDVRLVKLELEPVDKAGFRETGEKKEPKVKRIIKEHDTARVFIGKVPVMVRSNFCHLRNLND
jgi:DNA-directed RNA polymerase II subunit RPB2